MLSLVYASSASRPITDSDLDQLLAAARLNNERHGITGLLLYKDGNFMQAIEGPDEAVNRVFDHIRQDSRHHGVLLLLKQQVTERQFPNWSMSLQNVDRLGEPHRSELSKFLSDQFTAESYRNNPAAAVKLLLTFRDIVR
ncbi:MAG TPA: BLUF domain-containing protein [Steroidobacteraceae bacterium]|nr:BLUF domain-containing protein [Steroidobacteraceae bacterium]